MDKPTRFSDLKTRVQSSFGKATPYVETTEPYDEDID